VKPKTTAERENTCRDDNKKGPNGKSSDIEFPPAPLDKILSKTIIEEACT